MIGPRWELRHAYGFQGYRDDSGGGGGDGSGGGGDGGSSGGDGSSGGGDSSGGFGGSDSGASSGFGGFGGFGDGSLGGFGGGFGSGFSDGSGGTLGSSGYGGSGFSGYSGGFSVGQDAGNSGTNAFGGQGYGISQSGDYSQGFTGTNNPAYGATSNSFLSKLFTPSNILNSILGFALGGLPGLGMSMLGNGLNAWGATEGLPGLGSGVMAGKALLSGKPIGAILGLASASRQGLFGDATPGSALSGNLGNNNISNLGGSQSLAMSRQSINHPNNQINPAILALLAGAYTNKGNQNG